MDNTYERELLSYASKLDALTDGCGEIIKIANAVVNGQDRDSIISLLKKATEIVNSGEWSKEVNKVSLALHNCLFKYFGHIKVSEICNSTRDTEDTRSLEELLKELDNLVGLYDVKTKVNDLIAYQTVQKMRENCGLHNTKNTLHIAFTGKPGTGKTTVARIVGRIYKQIGLLSKGHFIEVSRTDLIAGYQGQTALKVKKVIEQAKGGVLFIDEAYSITENNHSDSYGRECLTELTKALEDYREDLVVIAAGYTEPMNKFFESNPGLKSRFNTFIEFQDYSADELEGILDVLCKNNDYKLNEEARIAIKEALIAQVSSKNENFANGRVVRNLYDDLVMNHAKRVVNLCNPGYEELSTIIAEDFSSLRD